MLVTCSRKQCSTVVPRRPTLLADCMATAQPYWAAQSQKWAKVGHSPHQSPLAYGRGLVLFGLRLRNYPQAAAGNVQRGNYLWPLPSTLAWLLAPWQLCQRHGCLLRGRYVKGMAACLPRHAHNGHAGTVLPKHPHICLGYKQPAGAKAMGQVGRTAGRRQRAFGDLVLQCRRCTPSAA